MNRKGSSLFRRWSGIVLGVALCIVGTTTFAGPARHDASPAHPVSTQHAPIENFAEVSRTPPPFLFALINFAVLLLLFAKYAVPSIRRFVSDRHESVAKDVREAAELRAQARAKLVECEAKLASLDSDIQRMMAEIRKEAEGEKARILADAAARAQRIIEETEQQVQAERLYMRQQLESEMACEAISAAEQLLKTKMTELDHQRLADQFNEELELSVRRRAA